MKYLIAILLLVTTSCSGQKIKSAPVTNFNAQQYLGEWYEIARTDNRFEKGCTDVTATYAPKDDGGLRVTNKCLVNGKEKIAKGKAYFKEDEKTASLKVTFFWPIYGNYNVIYLDKDYQYSVVDGGGTKYLWILSRKKTIDDKTLKMLQDKIRENGVDPATLIYTKHRD